MSLLKKSPRKSLAKMLANFAWSELRVIRERFTWIMRAHSVSTRGRILHAIHSQMTRKALANDTHSRAARENLFFRRKFCHQNHSHQKCIKSWWNPSNLDQIYQILKNLSNFYPHMPLIIPICWKNRHVNYSQNHRVNLRGFCVEFAREIRGIRELTRCQHVLAYSTYFSRRFHAKSTHANLPGDFARWTFWPFLLNALVKDGGTHVARGQCVFKWLLRLG